VSRLNRAACHLKLTHFSACIHDCDSVLESLNAAEPAVAEGRHADAAGWSRMFVKVHARRAAALAKMGMHLHCVVRLKCKARSCASHLWNPCVASNMCRDSRWRAVHELMLM
jgi:hypothetical protein